MEVYERFNLNSVKSTISKYCNAVTVTLAVIALVLIFIIIFRASPEAAAPSLQIVENCPSQNLQGYNICEDNTASHDPLCCGVGKCNSSCHECLGGCLKPEVFEVDLFEQKDLQGDMWRLPVNPRGCTNIFHLAHCNKTSGQCSMMNDVVSSVDTKGKCVKLYEHRDCKGAAIIVFPGSECQRDFKKCGHKGNMDDNASSIAPCKYIVAGNKVPFRNFNDDFIKFYRSQIQRISSADSHKPSEENH